VASSGSERKHISFSTSCTRLRRVKRHDHHLKWKSCWTLKRNKYKKHKWNMNLLQMGVQSTEYRSWHYNMELRAQNMPLYILNVTNPKVLEKVMCSAMVISSYDTSSSRRVTHEHAQYKCLNKWSRPVVCFISNSIG
jgi:hypothetical protein